MKTVFSYCLFIEVFTCNNKIFWLVPCPFGTVHILPEEFETRQSPAVLDLCSVRKTRSGKSRDYRDVIVFEKLRLQNVFRPHESENPTFPNSSG